MPKKLFLIDGNSFCYRAFYAIRALSNSKGQPTNAIYGFVTMLNKLVKDNSPDMLAVAFDLKGPTFRHKRYEEYKIHRKPMPDDLIGQMPYIKRIVQAYNIPIYELEGFEADDLLATIAVKAEERGIDTFIVTGDKDALQLVDAHIKVYSPHKEDLIYDAAKVKEAYGVSPDKMIDIMALMGDLTDNIPGVKGIGEKTAVELISEFGSLDNLLENVNKVKGEAKKKLLKDNVEMARLSKELAVLDRDVPIKIDFKELELKEPDRPVLFELFKEMEFKALLKGVMPEEKLDSAYELIDDDKRFNKLIAELKALKEFTFDCETTSEDPMLAKLVGISFSWQVGKAHYVPVNEFFDVDNVLAELKPIFEDEKIKKNGQNIKYEYIVLSNYGIELKGIIFDTMVASYILNPSKLNHNLEDISLEYLEHKLTTPIQALLGKGKSAITMDKVDVKRVSDYCCEDSDVTLRLKKILEKEIDAKGLDKLFYDVEIPLVSVLSIMEINGVAIDKDYLAELSVEMQGKLDKLTKSIYGLAGKSLDYFNALCVVIF